MLKTLSKFVLEILPPVAATVIGAYLVHQFIAMPRDAAQAARNGAPQVVTIAKDDLDRLIGASHAAVPPAAAPEAATAPHPAAGTSASVAAAAPATVPAAAKPAKRPVPPAKTVTAPPADPAPPRAAPTAVAALPSATAAPQPQAIDPAPAGPSPAAVAAPPVRLQQDPLRIDTHDRDRLSAIAGEPLDLSATAAPSLGQRGRTVIGRVWASVTGALSDGLR